MTAVTYASIPLPTSGISAKRQLAMLKDSYSTMVTAVAIVLRRQGFMAEERDGNRRQVVALQPSADVTYFLPAPVIGDAWEQQGDAWVRSSASAVFGDDIGVQVGPISSAASKRPPMSATDLHDIIVRVRQTVHNAGREVHSQLTNDEGSEAFRQHLFARVLLPAQIVRPLT